MKRLLTLPLLFTVGLTFAQESMPIRFSGSLQFRSEADGRDFNHETAPMLNSSMRTRLAATAMILDQASVVFELQDTRLLGGETPTISNKASIGAHQVYFLLPLAEGISLQAGRFEMAYGNERLFGSVGWSMTARSFDGFRLKTNLVGKLDFFMLTIKKSFQTKPQSPPYMGFEDIGADIVGSWLQLPVNDQLTLDAFAWYELNRSELPKEKLSRYTVGSNLTFKTDDLLLTGEGAFQGGNLDRTVDVSAWMVSASASILNLTGDKSALTVGADLLSGTAAGDTDFKTFDVSYGTNHKFYGFMDYFLGNPLTGLQDFYLKLKQENLVGDWTFQADAHLLNSAEAVAGETAYGTELDLTASTPLMKGIKSTLGASVFLPGDLMKSVYSSSDQALWLYWQLNVMF